MALLSHELDKTQVLHPQGHVYRNTKSNGHSLNVYWASSVSRTRLEPLTHAVFYSAYLPSPHLQLKECMLSVLSVPLVGVHCSISRWLLKQPVLTVAEVQCELTGYHRIITLLI